MAPSNAPSCFLIGADTLLTECGEQLIERGFDVRGVITRGGRVRDWAAGRGLLCLDLDEDWRAALAGGGFDYLFAITHLELLPAEVLALPTVGAVNFHDAPLPDYAGLYCPVWGLLDGRSEWGVSWHWITTGIDTGDLLAERRFPVAPDETSISINTKCFQAGLDSFGDLLDQILAVHPAGRPDARPQGAPTGRMCRGKDRPAAGGVIDWRRPASDLARTVRALDFGRYPNAFAQPRCLLPDGRVVSVHAAGAVEASGAAGAVLALEPGRVTIGCGQGALEITSLRGADGSELELGELGLKVGSQLEAPSPELQERLARLARRAASREPQIVAALEALEPTELPHVERRPAPGAEGEGRHEFELPTAFVEAFPGAPAAAAAFAAWIGRLSGQAAATLALRHPDNDARIDGATAFCDPRLVVATPFDPDQTFGEFATAFAAASHASLELGPLQGDLIARYPSLAARPELSRGRLLPLGVQPDGLPGRAAGDLLTLCPLPAAPRAALRYDSAQLGPADAERIAEQFFVFLEGLAAHPAAALAELPLIGAAELERLVAEFKAVDVDLDGPLTLAAQFEAQVDRSPDEKAATFDGVSLTYAELDAAANRLANHLLELGLEREQPVALHLQRGLSLPIGMLGVLKAGGCYVPLDPDFPSARLDYMLEHSRAQLLISEAALDGALKSRTGCRRVCLDTEAAAIDARPPTRPAPGSTGTDLAYVIYTSGSTGKPKGVAVEQHNVANFFVGMDQRLVPRTERPGVWLAVTSLSFDISVLELLWTLTRGFEVCLHRDRTKSSHLALSLDTGRSERPEPIDFSIFLWGNDDGPGSQKYRLMLESAKFGDANGFEAIWTPERHFHAFGGPFPNPSVVSAAIAVVTTRIRIHSGSCVLPLHHPLRVAEEWSVVDNLSNGRVGLSVASGWQPDDFVLRPEGYADNKRQMMEMLDQVRRLWRGEALPFTNPLGDEVVRLPLPRPVQPELPVWVTSAGNPETYRLAGECGANVLTHLLGQSVEEVADKIRVYREARAAAGHDPATGRVTLMLHAFVGDDVEAVRELVRGPMKSYLDAAVGLVKKYAWSFPTFKDADSVADIDLDSVTPEEQDAILEHAFARYFDESGLFGTPESCVEMVDTLKAIGVDEIGCLVDYGVPTDTVLAMLPKLAELLQRSQPIAPAKASPEAEQGTPGALMERHGVTHLQCTPSMARMLLADDRARAGLAKLERLAVGGEACPLDLAQDLADAVPNGVVTNMYGPTETTIWSSVSVLERGLDEVTIGTPIANTRLHVLGASRRPLPAGVAGELWIGGRGVVRGYFGADEMTAERFVPELLPGVTAGGRMYRTGDLALRRGDGSFGFLGRIDHQVKVRGYRIELGEIESALLAAPEVAAAVVIAREDTPGDQRLVGYVSPRPGAAIDASELKARLRQSLPEYMVPGHLVELERLPETPNGKLDRKALPAPEEVLQTEQTAPAAPLESDLENRLAAHWSEVLGRAGVGATDNFFELGGHSLLVVKLHRRLAGDLEQAVSLTDLYRFPTIRGLAGFLTGGADTAAVDESARRGEARRAALQARRGRLRRR